MKKFNSTLAIAAIALTSVFGFTSCDKDNDAFNNGPQPQRIEIHSETSGNKTTTTVTTGSGTNTTTTTYVSTNDTEKAAEDNAGTNEARRGPHFPPY